MDDASDLSIEDAEYVLNLPYHLIEAAKEGTTFTEDLCRLLTDYEFIEHKNYHNH
jgi:hypothetical protein